MSTTERIEIQADLGILDQLEERLRRIGQSLGPLSPGGGGGGGGGGGWGGRGGGGGGSGGGGSSDSEKKSKFFNGTGSLAGAAASGSVVESFLRNIPGIGGPVADSLRYIKESVAVAAAYQRAAAPGRAYGMPGGIVGGYGYSPVEAAGMGSRLFGGAGIGHVENNGALFSTALGFSRAGIDIGAQASLLRGFSAGGGSTFFGNSVKDGSDMAGVIKIAVAQGMLTGLKEARVGEYLQAMAGEGSRFADKGIGYDVGRGLVARNALSAAGLPGMQGNSAMSAMRGSLGGEFTKVFNPGMKRALLSAYMGANTTKEYDFGLAGMLKNDDEIMKFYQWAAALYGPELGYKLVQDLTGMGPQQAEDTLNAKLPSGAAEWGAAASGLTAANPRAMAGKIPTGLMSFEAGQQAKKIGFGSKRENIKTVRDLDAIDSGTARAIGSGVASAYQALMPDMSDLKAFAADPVNFLKNKVEQTGSDFMHETGDFFSGKAGPLKGFKDSIKGFIQGSMPPGPSEPQTPNPKAPGDQSSLMINTGRGIVRIELVNGTGRPIAATVVNHGDLVAG